MQHKHFPFAGCMIAIAAYIFRLVAWLASGESETDQIAKIKATGSGTIHAHMYPCTYCNPDNVNMSLLKYVGVAVK